MVKTHEFQRISAFLFYTQGCGKLCGNCAKPMDKSEETRNFNRDGIRKLSTDYTPQVDDNREEGKYFDVFRGIPYRDASAAILSPDMRTSLAIWAGLT